MARMVLSVAGAAVGTYFGGPIGGAVGSAIGSYIGGMIDNQLFGKTSYMPAVVGPRLAELGIQVSTYGKALPVGYGNFRTAGNVIWCTDIREEQVTTQTEQDTGGGKGSGGASVVSTSITFKYYATLAIGICEGPIKSINRVWADSQVITNELLGSDDDKYNVYLGDETQTPDPIIESFEGAGNVPAYRGMAYVVIKDFPLEDYGNRIPNFTFEIVREAKLSPAVEDLVESIMIIPGSGEFVYDTTLITKKNGSRLGDGTFVEGGTTERLNMHNWDNVADVKKSLDQLQDTFPNLQRVGLAVAWFSNSKFLATSTITPRIEHAYDDSTTIPYDWSVGSFDRSNTQLVAEFPDESKTYGGTPSDKSIINLLLELDSRGIDVMFYPFLQIDTTGEEGGGEEAKPWRGRMTPTSTLECNTWFTQSNGYNDFIFHYANLSVDGHNLKDLVEVFVIGSEMRGITQYMPTSGVFPGVSKFVTLAATIKGIVGGGVKVGYAADWSEYHSVNGWFNMDPLWTSANIDFIGIDAYFPLTPDIDQTQITEDKIKEYWEKGEGWDYFYTDSEARTGLTSYSGDPTYAWKNFEHWWSTSTHTNPDASTTAWTSKAKPLWFTEYGFASVDGAANQPNVFVDDTSVEGYYPRASKQRIDFNAQREAINATEEHLEEVNGRSGNSNLVPRRYLWTWDARPFPQFPDFTQVWSDGPRWRTGHWVNGKLGGASLRVIVERLLNKSGLQSNQYDCSRLTDLMDGIINTRVMSTRDWLVQLQSAFFFDCVESDGLLKFVKRGGESVQDIDEQELMPISNNQDLQEIFKINRTQELDLPLKVSVTYIDRVINFQNSTQLSQRQVVSAVDEQDLNLPIVMNQQKAKQIADVTLFTSWLARNTYQLTLPPQFIKLEPTDIITVTVNNVNYTMRLVKTDVSRFGIIECSAVAEDVSTYDFYSDPGTSGGGGATQPLVIDDTTTIYLDLPCLPNDSADGGLLRIACTGVGSNWFGTVVYRSDDGGELGGNTWGVIGSLNSNSIIGTILEDVDPGSTDVFDNTNVIDVFLQSGTLSSVNELAVLNGANVCVINGEVIQFQTVTILDADPKKLRLSKLLRGRLGTEWANALGHEAGDRFVFLDSNIIKSTMAASLFNQTRYYKPVSVRKTLTSTEEETYSYSAVRLKPLSPVNITGEIDLPSSDDWTISWVRRTRVNGDWLDLVGEVPLNEETEAYEIDIMDGVDVVRTLTSSTPTVVYTSAQQTTDFGSPQSSIEVNIYQLSAVVGRGYAGNAIL